MQIRSIISTNTIITITPPTPPKKQPPVQIKASLRLPTNEFPPLTIDDDDEPLTIKSQDYHPQPINLDWNTPHIQMTPRLPQKPPDNETVLSGI